MQCRVTHDAAAQVSVTTAVPAVRESLILLIAHNIIGFGIFLHFVGVTQHCDFATRVRHPNVCQVDYHHCTTLARQCATNRLSWASRCGADHRDRAVVYTFASSCSHERFLALDVHDGTTTKTDTQPMNRMELCWCPCLLARHHGASAWRMVPPTIGNMHGLPAIKTNGARYKTFPAFRRKEITSTRAATPVGSLVGYLVQP